jgi:hypothetical protein
LKFSIWRILLANHLYREALIASIESGIRQAQQASALEHPGLTGEVREIAADA